MIPSATWGRRLLFQRENWARLLLDTICHYRGSACLLQEFPVMPDPIQVLLTRKTSLGPKTSLEKAVPFIQGGFSYRAKKELGSNMQVWQKRFSDHRLCDTEDYRQHVLYVRQNPIRKRRCHAADEFPHSSPQAGFEFHPSSEGLKPDFLNDCDGAPFPGRPVARDRTATGQC
jgi:putative transposase